MGDTDGRFLRAGRVVLAAARRHLKRHPSLEQMLAYQEGGLPTPVEAEVRAHLAVCGECAQTVLDVGSFPDLKLKEGAAGPVEELAPAWGDVWASIQEEAGRSANGGSARGWRPQEKALAALVACLLIAVVGLGLWWSLVSGRAAGAPDPAVNVQIFNLVPDGESVTRDPYEDQNLVVPADPDRFVLVLNLARSGSYQGYRVELSSVGETAVAAYWSSDSVAPTALGTFHLGFARGFLPAGRYHLRLSGIEEQGPVDLARYAFSIEYD